MIVKKNFNPLKVLFYIWEALLFSFIIAALVFYFFEIEGVKEVNLPFTPVGVLGTAVAFFLGFRNNAAYGRWWEARQIWGNTIQYSRTFARLIITFVDAHRHTPQYNPAKAPIFKKEMIYRQIAWVHTLRLQLRNQENWAEIRPFLSEDDFEKLQSKANKAHYLLQIQGQNIYQAMAEGTLQGFDSFQLEGCLAQFAAQQASCERIKNTPVPRQYDYFTRVFLYFFLATLPFGLIANLSQIGIAWAVIPLTLLIALVYSALDKTGVVNETPFENQIQDIPLTALCREIERDLKESLEENQLPPKLEPQKGYLF
ncbi:MAG: bestrophin family ion channel [Microscillaceae bacterium]|nr:bestrophin family ion channel [Microscillaceae bacterium]